MAALFDGDRFGYLHYGVDDQGRVWRIQNAAISWQPHSLSTHFHSAAELQAAGYTPVDNPLD